MEFRAKVFEIYSLKDRPKSRKRPIQLSYYWAINKRKPTEGENVQKPRQTLLKEFQKIYTPVRTFLDFFVRK